MPQILVNQNEYLAHATHSGGGRTKGSKNGVRRWQNPDGTLTEAGKIHYGQMYGWGQKTENAGEIAKAAKNSAETLTRTGNNIYKDYKTSKIKNQRKEEAKTMSDQELQEVVKRLNLEKKYVDATTPEVRSGADKALQALEVVGALATTAVAVGTVLQMISKAKAQESINNKK